MKRATHFFTPPPLAGEGRGRGKKSTQSAPSALLLSHKWAGGIVAAFLLPALGVQAGSLEPASVNQQIAVCAGQSDTGVRLACYDRLAAQLATSEEPTAAAPAGSAGTQPINEENALFKLSCAYFAKDC